MKKMHGLAYLYLLLTFSLWGSLYVVSKFVLGKLPAFTVAFFRFLIAYVALSVLVSGREKIRLQKEDRKYIFLIGFLGYFIAVGAQLLGTKFAGPSMASLINSLNPLTMTLAAAILLKEKLTKGKVFGILAAFGGVYVILGGGRGVNWPGVLLSLFAVAGWSFVSVMAKKTTLKYDALQITRKAIGIAAVCNLPAGAAQLFRERRTVSLDLACIVGLIYMGVFCTGMAYILWNKSLSLLEAGTCSAFYPIQPLVSTIFGVLFLHETVGLRFFAGAFLIVAGVLTSLLWNKE